MAHPTSESDGSCSISCVASTLGSGSGADSDPDVESKLSALWMQQQRGSAAPVSLQRIDLLHPRCAWTFRWSLKVVRTESAAASWIVIVPWVTTFLHRRWCGGLCVHVVWLVIWTKWFSWYESRFVCAPALHKFDHQQNMSDFLVCGTNLHSYKWHGKMMQLIWHEFDSKLQMHE